MSSGIVTVPSNSISDVTGVFLRNLISLVDVRDFGAVGDGVTDDSAAFEAADQAANGRRIFVPEGTYLLAQNTSVASEISISSTRITAPFAPSISRPKCP